MNIKTRAKITTFASTKQDIDTVIQSGAEHIIIENPKFSIRAFSKHNKEDISELVTHTRQNYQNVLISISMDIVLHHQDIGPVEDYIQSLQSLDIDYIRIQDVGLLSLLQEHIPHVNVVFVSETGPHNTAGIELLKNQGIDTHQFNNETPYSEIKQITKNIDSHWGIQVHGHILIQHSHRRLLYDKASDMQYSKKVAMDHDFPDRYYTFYDTIHGCFMYAHFERCLISQIEKLKKLNLDHWLIDLRGESTSYLINTIQTYRQLRDDPTKVPLTTLETTIETLEAQATKPLKAGFFTANQTDIDWRNKKWDQLDELNILGYIVDIKKNQFITIEPIQTISDTDQLCILTPEQKEIVIKNRQIYNTENTPIETSRTGTFIKLKWQKGVCAGSLLIKK